MLRDHFIAISDLLMAAAVSSCCCPCTAPTCLRCKVQRVAIRQGAIDIEQYALDVREVRNAGST
jgi:hypothetical protein